MIVRSIVLRRPQEICSNICSCGQALTPEQRRKFEQPLLGDYLFALREALPEGAQGTFPDTETAWRQYSSAMAWGLVIGWLICVRPTTRLRLPLPCTRCAVSTVWG